MRVSVTSATGSVIVRELPGAGHQVPGLALSGGAASPLAAARAGAYRGTPEESGSRRADVAGQDAPDPGAPAEIAADLA